MYTVSVLIRISSLLSVIVVSLIACQRNPALSKAESGGLGLLRSSWEDLHGPSIGEDSASVRYRLQRTEISLNFSNANSASYVAIQYPDGDPESLEDARTLARTLIPIDSLHIGTYHASTGGIVDSYVSLSLARLNKDWDGEKPGSFVVWYENEKDVIAFTIRIGKGPPATGSSSPLKIGH